MVPQNTGRPRPQGQTMMRTSVRPAHRGGMRPQYRQPIKGPGKQPLRGLSSGRIIGAPLKISIPNKGNNPNKVIPSQELVEFTFFPSNYLIV